MFRVLFFVNLFLLFNPAFIICSLICYFKLKIQKIYTLFPRINRGVLNNFFVVFCTFINKDGELTP